MLSDTHRTLSSTWYYEPDHYRRELESIWWQDWLCLARMSEWPTTGLFQVFVIGDQQIIITRSASGELQAFHNTCRHRGAQLCSQEHGTFSQNRIVCPYHAWTYSLEGKLTGTPRRVESADFNAQDWPLYRVAIQTRAGFVFVNLAQQPETSLPSALGSEIEALSNWPLSDLALAHRETHVVQCNWKIFWENFLECYHCPGIHPDLCRLVPIYGQGVMAAEDLPATSPNKAEMGQRRLRTGAVTWSADGLSSLPWFDGLSAEEKQAGMTFTTLLPSVFIVAHVDYVRSVHVLPLGPEKTQLTVNWLLQPQTLQDGKVDIERLTEFGRQVVLEDAHICALNQKGQHSIRHDRGVLLPQEYDVQAFDNWVLQRLGEAPL